MEERIFYPAVFHKEEKGYWVSFPDIPEALTQGDSLQEAYEMAVDCLGLSCRGSTIFSYTFST